MRATPGSYEGGSVMATQRTKRYSPLLQAVVDKMNPDGSDHALRCLIDIYMDRSVAVALRIEAASVALKYTENTFSAVQTETTIDTHETRVTRLELIGALASADTTQRAIAASYLKELPESES
jgi:hypothetical protein